MSSHRDANATGGGGDAPWVLMAAGAISVIFGLLAISYPDVSLLVLAILTGINLLMMGVLGLVGTLSGDDDEGGTEVLAVVLGILGVIGGLVVVRRPGETLLALVLVVGIWLVVSGVVELLRGVVRADDRGRRLLAGTFDVAFGAVILSWPDLSLRTLAVLAGLSFVVRGAVSIYRGWRLSTAESSSARGLAAT